MDRWSYLIYTVWYSHTPKSFPQRRMKSTDQWFHVSWNGRYGSYHPCQIISVGRGVRISVLQAEGLKPIPWLKEHNRDVSEIVTPWLQIGNVPSDTLISSSPWPILVKRVNVHEPFDGDTTRECNFNECSLRWRHNGCGSVSNHQPYDCLLNRLFRRRSKKTSKLRVTGLCAGIHRGPVNSPHKWSVTRKMFPFDDVIMSFPGNVIAALG